MTEEIKKRINTIKAGKVPDGYKKNKFGIFPTEWVTNKVLGEIGTFGKGRGIPGTMLGTGNVPCVGYGDIYMKYDQFHFEKARSFVDEQTAQESFPIGKGTLLFTGTGETAEEIGKCVCYNGDETIYAGGDIITFNSQTIDPLFLAYQQYQDFSLKRKARLGQGHSVVHIHKENLENLPVAFPPSQDEQQKISAILLKWDKAIELQEQLIEKLELQKKALMQKILVPKENWKTVKIRDVFSITRGNVLATEECNDSYKYPVYSSQTKHNGLLGYYNKFLFENAITWTTDGANAGKVTYRTGKFYCTNVCGVLINDNGYANPCFAYILNTVTPNYVSYVGNPKLMNNVMGNITVTVPELKDQEKFSKIIMLLDKKIEKNMDQLMLFKQQQKSMQQLLLTGIVRV